MSRSYKKKPWCCDSQPWAKQQANKKVRRYKDDIPNGNAYRKIYDPWSICDYKSRYDLNEYLLLEKSRTTYFIGQRLREYNETETIKYWHKYYHRK